MKIHRLYMLRPRELRAIHESLGGKYSYKERLQRDGTGSPFLYYTGGHPEIDVLNDRCVDLLRINFEEFQEGLMLGVSERTEPYIMPLRPGDIDAIEVRLQPEKVEPRQGSFFYWLLANHIPLSIARFFAGSTEYEEPKTHFHMQLREGDIHAWIMAGEYRKVRSFFERSLFKNVLKAE